MFPFKAACNQGVIYFVVLIFISMYTPKLLINVAMNTLVWFASETSAWYMVHPLLIGTIIEWQLYSQVTLLSVEIWYLG